MPDRLPALDASVLYGEAPSTPMHVGSVAVFERHNGGLDFDTLLQVIGQRLDYLPRYRKRLLPVPGHLAPPVWTDDVDFDLGYHVRRSALPTPGSDHQLFDLVARLMQRPLDRERPLWEAYYIEGLEGDRVALVTKAHQVLVDGARTVDLAQVLFDEGAADRAPAQAEWTPRRLPGWPRLVADVVTGAAARPADMFENVRFLARDVASSVGRTAQGAGALAAAARSMTGRPSVGPARRLNSRVSGGRVFAGVRADLEDFKRIRSTRECTVNDVIFTVLTGALRKWLESRGQHVPPAASVRALVPTAVQHEDSEFSPAELTTSRLVPYLIDLPVGEPDPMLRLQHVAHEMAGQFGSDRPVTARAMVRMGGFAPATMNALAARVAGWVPRRGFNVLIANTPGPQETLYAGRGRLSAMYPVLPLGRDQSLAVGVTSYQGGVYFGLNGDRKAMHDVDVLAEEIEESLEELRGNKW